MHRQVEGLVALYDGGRITRRQLLHGLVAMGIGARGVADTYAAGTATGSVAPVFQTRTINHVTLIVKDVGRSKAFYQSLTGLPVREEDATFCELNLENSFLGLYAAEPGQQTGIDHLCFGVTQFQPQDALAKLKATLPNAQPTLENESQVYVRDPDGARVQVADVKYKR